MSSILIYRAHNIRKSLGVRCAAGYLRNRGVSFEQAYRTIFGREPRK